MSTIASIEGAWAEPASGRKLAYRLWRPLNPLALLVLIHGFGEHSGRYASFASDLARQGIAVAAADLWGHGRSGGQRGDAEQAAVHVRHTQQIIHEVFLPTVAQRHYTLFGHSFGGLVAILLALEASSGLRRLIVQSPLLEVGFALPFWKTAAAACLAVCWPRFSFSMNLDARALAHNPMIAEAYRADPLVHNFMTARTYRSILAARDAVCGRAAELQVPVLLLGGAEDRIISLSAAERWYERLVCEKRRMIFPGSYHELHHEPVRGEVLQLIRDWTLADGRP